MGWMYEIGLLYIAMCGLVYEIIGLLYDVMWICESIFMHEFPLTWAFLFLL